jgi:hypothetical protein
MAVYLSPGVFVREIDLSAVPNSSGPIRPAFVGTAKKGPIGRPMLLTNAQQALDVFGEPFPESNFMYGILAYMEEGGSCFGLRVAVECADGLPDALSDICVDTSGGKGKGWGRIPLFSGIDYGRINLRVIDSDNPITFHAASVSTPEYNDADLSDTNGVTDAALETQGTYTGAIDDSFVMTITEAPNNTADDPAVDGAGYSIVRNSDGEEVASGTLSDGNDVGVSTWISIGAGLSVRVVVSDGSLDVNDTFTFSVAPNNRVFSVSVDGEVATDYTMPATTYTTLSAFVTAFNALVSGEDYAMIAYTLADGETVVPQLRTSDAGERIQIMSTQGWALEVGTQQFAWDIPRGYLIGLENEPYTITAQNNRVKINVIGTVTETIEFSVGNGVDTTVDNLANVINAAGVVAGERFFEAFTLLVPDGETGEPHLVIMASDTHSLDTLALQATYSNIKTLRFAEEINIVYPYKRSYRGYSDNRVLMPDAGEDDPAIPLSCEVDSGSADCVADTAYFAGIVGFLVANSAGTWITPYSVSLELFTEGIGETAGRFKLVIRDANNQVVDAVTDVSFDKSADRYIGNVINPGSKYGGTAGNAYVSWEPRPTYLAYDPVNAPSEYVVRQPSQFNVKRFTGAANGIPTDPAYSSELDAAVIGNPSISSGLHAFQNPEAYDVSLLITPGFSTGAIIATALQLCESRGDMLYLVDPPFGLRPQQVVDWHNGMLLSDLSTAVNSSYGSLYWGWIKSFDQFNAIEVWVPPSGHVAAVFSRTARDAEQWFAPAGLRRGRLLTALDLEYAPTQGENDLLYGSGNAVNPIVKFAKDGIVVWGQRTLLRTASALDRVSVRMLLIQMKRDLTSLLRQFVHEPHDRITWKQVLTVLDPYMSNIQARRGVSAYKIICDETNNTPDRIDRHELWVSVLFRPTPTTEFVVLNMVALRSSASFSAEEALAAAGVSAAATAT